MRVCELRKCEVINVRDCRRIGFAMDVEFEPSTGCIKAIIVPGPCSVFGFLGREKEFVIPWCSICKFGKDIILVDVYLDEVLVVLS